MLKKWRDALLDLIYPPRCPACRGRVVEQGAWCERCVPVRLVLHEAAPEGHRPANLTVCLTLLPYDGKVKELLHRLKFRPDPLAAAYFVWLLQNKVNWTKLQTPELVTPVPLSADRLTKRGFNQTELLFRPWCQSRRIKWGDVLARNRDTLPQWKLSSAERRKNIKGAFVVTEPDLVRSKTVLLVDDILTTGATLSECARTLKAAGATEVWALALASGAAER